MSDWLFIFCTSISFFCSAILRNIMTDSMLQPRNQVALLILYFSCLINVIAVWALPIYAFYSLGIIGGVVVLVGSIIVTGIINGAFFKGQAAYQIVVALTILNAIVLYSNIAPASGTYEDCILDNMPSTKTRIAAAEVRSACYKKFRVHDNL